MNRTERIVEINRKRHIEKFIAMVSRGVTVNEKGELCTQN